MRRFYREHPYPWIHPYSIHFPNWLLWPFKVVSNCSLLFHSMSKHSLWSYLVAYGHQWLWLRWPVLPIWCYIWYISWLLGCCGSTASEWVEPIGDGGGFPWYEGIPCLCPTCPTCYVNTPVPVVPPTFLDGSTTDLIASESSIYVTLRRPHLQRSPAFGSP